MNQSIKYQVWDKESQIMCTVCQLEWLDGKLYAHYVHSPHLGGVRKTLDTAKNPLFQFTGLYDKNGKESYESDLVKTREGVSEIVFADGSFWLDGPTRILISDRNVEMEAIGNIYENPGLLKDSTGD